MKTKFTITLSMFLLCGTSIAQIPGQAFMQTPTLPDFCVEFHHIVVSELDALSDIEEDRWETTNHCLYVLNSQHSTLNFQEWDPRGSLINSFSHPILEFNEDEVVYTVVFQDGKFPTKVVLWKDKSLVVFQTGDSNFLVSGKMLDAEN